MSYCIYQHTSPSGKSYIGQTNNYKSRCRQHQEESGSTAFSNAVKKYGWDEFQHRILAENLTLEEANGLEELAIIELNTIAPNGYNLLGGGNNRYASEQVKEAARLKTIEWIKANPELEKERRRKQTISKNRIETKISQSINRKNYEINNPELARIHLEKAIAAVRTKEAREENSNRRSKWCKENPEKAKLMSYRMIGGSSTAHAKRAGRPFSYVPWYKPKLEHNTH
jgi:group I intron endonuclease